MLTGKILEKEMATNFSILAWKIPWTDEPGGLQSMGSQKSDMIYHLNHHHQGKHNTQKTDVLGECSDHRSESLRR